MMMHPLTVVERRQAKWIARGLYLFAWTVAIGLIAWSCAGCSARYWTGVYQPETELRLPGGIKYHNSKDLDVQIKGLDAQYGGGSLKADEIVLRNNASDVNNSQVALMQMVALGQQTQIEYARQWVGLLERAIDTAAPLAAMRMQPQPEQQRDAIDRLNQIRELLGTAGVGLPLSPAPASLPAGYAGAASATSAPASQPAPRTESGEGRATTEFIGPSGFP